MRSAYAGAMPFWSKSPRVSDADWRAAVAATPLLRRLDPEAAAQVRALAAAFLKSKNFEGCGGLELDAVMRLRIAAQACVPIRVLGLDAYRDVRTILVYPDEFRSKWSFEDEMGVVHEEDRPLSGEAWSEGNVVLSWADVESSGAVTTPDADGTAYNVVVHEFAHAIDMLTGEEDGIPPLPSGVDRAVWRAPFDAACDHLRALEAADAESPIDPYAAENEAEAFAVFCEAFFETPWVVRDTYPDVFDRLRDFFGVDPG